MKKIIFIIFISVLTFSTNCFSANVTAQISASTNDAEEDLNDDSVATNSSDLELGVAKEGPLPLGQLVGMRFPSITIPQGSTIDSAKIQFTTDETSDSSVVTLEFSAEDADNPSAFTTTAADISGRTETTARVSWTPPAWLVLQEKGADQLSPELKTIVQEIVDRAGWVSGNALVIMLRFTSGSGSPTREKRTAESYDGVAGDAPEISIDYTVGSSSFKSYIY